MDETEKKIEIVYFDAGGGHRSTAQALAKSIQLSGKRWRVNLCDVGQLVRPTDPAEKILGKRAEDVYNMLYQKEWTVGFAKLRQPYQLLLRILKQKHSKLLSDYWLEQRPDLVVSVVPGLNPALYQSVRESLPGVPFVILPTDLSDLSDPSFWFGQFDCYAICGTDKIKNQALNEGIPESKIYRSSGPVIDPKYYSPKIQNIDEERTKNGLEPNRPTMFVAFGGYGSDAMITIQESLAKDFPEAQIIFICGKNEELRKDLSELAYSAPRVILGFVDNLPYWMDLADVFIGKTGTLFLTEAIARGLPVVTTLNYKTMVQEVPNVEWVREHGLGAIIKNFKETGTAMKSLCKPDNYQAVKKCIGIIHNRAVFEVPEILDKILSIGN